MDTIKLRNDQWQKIVTFLDENPKVYVGKAKDCRRFVEGVLWMMRSGAQWRLLAKRYGNWNSVFKRFDSWSEKGVWQELCEHFANDPDRESIMLDGSVIRAHVSAAGAVHKKGGKKTKPSVTVEAVSAARFT